MKLRAAFSILFAFLATHTAFAAPAPFDSNEARQSLDTAAQLMVVTTPEWQSSSGLLRRDHLYRWGVVVAHNAQSPQPGSGSCIFLHVWRAPERPTVGCTAMQQAELEEVIAWLDASKNPLLLQLPEKEYKTAQSAWSLP